MSFHYFDTEVAEKYGIQEAIIIQNLKFWIEKNMANEKNQHDGHTWTYNSVKAWSILLPYMSEKQIRAKLKKLEDDGILIAGNYNKSSYDRTKWYAFADEELWFGRKSICPEEDYHLPKRENGSAEKGEPIPYNKPYNKQDNKPYTNSVFDAWKSHTNLISHKTIKPHESAIKKALKNHSLEEIQSAIKNYAHVLGSQDHFWEYSWTLKDFLTRGLDRFLDEANPIENFKTKKGTSHVRTEADYERMAREILDDDTESYRLDRDEQGQISHRRTAQEDGAVLDFGF